MAFERDFTLIVNSEQYVFMITSVHGSLCLYSVKNEVDLTRVWRHLV